MVTVRPPPRSLPLNLQLLCLFGSMSGLVGWGIIAFGLIFVRIFAGDITPAELSRWSGELETAEGEITGVDYNTAQENEVYVNRVHFRFTARDMHLYEGASYITTDADVPTGPATVEHPVGDPAHARVRGMRATWFSPAVVFVWIFPGIGMLMAGYSLAHGLKARSLLVSGNMAEAALVSCEPTNARVNNKSVFKYTFAFEGPMGRQELTERSTRTRRLTDEPTERVLYDPGEPSRAVVFDLLPGAPVVMPDGRLAARSPRKLYAALIAPTLTVAIQVVWTLLT